MWSSSCGPAVADAAVGVGEPDAAGTVHHQVVGVVVPLPVQHVGQGRYGVPVLLEPDDAPASLLAAEQVARNVEAKAVDVVDAGEVLSGFAGFGVVPQQPASGDVGEDHGLTVPHGPLSGATVGSRYQFKVPTHGDYLLVGDGVQGILFRN